MFPAKRQCKPIVINLTGLLVLVVKQRKQIFISQLS